MPADRAEYMELLLQRSVAIAVRRLADPRTAALARSMAMTAPMAAVAGGGYDEDGDWYHHFRYTQSAFGGTDILGP
jgi:hypothetical protein